MVSSDDFLLFGFFSKKKRKEKNNKIVKCNNRSLVKQINDQLKRQNITRTKKNFIFKQTREEEFWKSLFQKPADFEGSDWWRIK